MDKRLLIGLLVLLVACESELPPSPPVPGGALVGSAIGGVTLSPAILPSWAAPIVYTDITPTFVRDGDVITVTVSKDFLNASTDKKFYAYAAMYGYNKNSRVWEKFIADASQSGRITRDWAKNKAVFLVPVSAPRFTSGSNFLIVYWCLDTELRDGQGFKIWNCNGRRWGLGSFEIAGQGFPNILIENNIGTNKYLNSTQRQTPDGVEYEALYNDTGGITSVKVIQLNNVTAYKQSLVTNLPLIESLWGALTGSSGNACGFFQPEGKKHTYLSGSNKVVVQSFGQSLDLSKISAYNLRYQSDCGLLDELRRLVAGVGGSCGNGVVDVNEACDGRNDSACLGLCKPDCSCSLRGPAKTGICGDFKVQTPNGQEVIETCEPPEVRDLTGVLRSGSPCFIRDPITGVLTGNGHCNAQCSCVSGTLTLPPCGNGNCETAETFLSCPADCPPESVPPKIIVNIPFSGQVFTTNAIVYTILATDDSGVVSCTASTDKGPKEAMTGIGISWKLTKLLTGRNHAVVFECADSHQNQGSAEISFATALASQVGNFKAIILDQDKRTIDGANVTLHDSKLSVVGNALSSNGNVIFGPLEYGQYSVDVIKKGFIPAGFSFSLIEPSLEMFVYLTPIVQPTVTPAAKDQTCLVPVAPIFQTNVEQNPDPFCSGFILDDWVQPPVFVQRYSPTPNGVPNLIPPKITGKYDLLTNVLTCTIPCSVEVKYKCLKELNTGNVDYTQNSVVDWMCGAYTPCTTTSPCGVSEVCVNNECRGV